ncbi:MAG: cytochrome b, partial [Bdellovibrionales bacterium]
PRMDRQETTYDPVAKAIHWGVAALIFVMFVSALCMDAPDSLISPENRPTVYLVHKSTGVLVLLLMVFRLFWFHIKPRPPLPVHLMPPWQVVAARIVHVALYILAILTPLVGWALVSMGTNGWSFFTLFELPRLPLAEFATSHVYLREITGDMHETCATIFAGLIVIHIGATFLHHFVDRDDVLLRISPVCLHGWLKRLRGE